MNQGKVIVIYGARQVGKTTLSKRLAAKYDGVFLNCERGSVKNLLQSRNISQFQLTLGERNCVILDEAQRIEGIGEILKLFVDEIPDIQIIATGSSSFDLANETAEPLTGRKVTFTLYPISVTEAGFSPVSFTESLPDILRYGLYPDILMTKDEKKKRILLDELASDYLYRDVLEYGHMKKPELLMKLLKAIALQLGSEVSLRELATLLQTSGETIDRYIHLLEQSFVIFRLPSFSRNLRKELAKKQKIYFFDLGIRNSLLQNFTPIDLRNDIGALWENFFITERMKHHQKNREKVNMYFWRTYDQKKIDLIEEKDGEIVATEIKWNNRKKKKLPRDFLLAYPESTTACVSPENFMTFFSG